MSYMIRCINFTILRYGRNGQHFADNIFRHIIMYFSWNFIEVGSKGVQGTMIQDWFMSWLGALTGGKPLTHWGRVTHICVGKLTTIGSDNGLSPGWRQAIIWTIAEILLIGPLGTNFSEILIWIQTFSFKKMQLKMSSAKWRPFCLGLNVLTETMMT